LTSSKLRISYIEVVTDLEEKKKGQEEKKRGSSTFVVGKRV